jgi:hypothetical protein
MKLLYCQDCGDITAPWPQANKPKYCRCGRHAVWWVHPSAGILRVYDKYGNEGQPIEARAYVLGLTNAWLLASDHVDWTGDKSIEIADQHPESYLFKTRRHCIVRFRPGESGDTRWANLPAERPSYD